MNKRTNIYYSILIAIIIITLFARITYVINEDKHESNQLYSCQIYEKTLEIKYEQAKANLIDDIQHYIDTIAPSSTLNAITLLECCDKYNIDVKFALAQGHLESHFGTRGIASKTNSVFNVLSYDNLTADQIIKSGNGYKHPDFSVEPYTKLLRERYLGFNKTEADLMDKFIDCNGKRYASNKNYEEHLLSIYNKINQYINIDKTIDEYKKYKILINI